MKKNHYILLFPESKNNRISITFTDQVGLKTFIDSPNDIKVKGLLLAFAKEKGINPNILGKVIYFLYNGCKININKDKDLISYGLRSGSDIIIVDAINTIGRNSNC